MLVFQDEFPEFKEEHLDLRLQGELPHLYGEFLWILRGLLVSIDGCLESLDGSMVTISGSRMINRWLQGEPLWPFSSKKYSTAPV